MNTPDFAGGGRRSDGPSPNLRRLLAAVSVASLLVAGRAWAVAAGSQFSVVPTPTSRAAGQVASPTVVVSATQADAEQATAEPSSSIPEDPAPPASPTTARKISGPVASTATPTVAAPPSVTRGPESAGVPSPERAVARETSEASAASAKDTRIANAQTIKASGKGTVDVPLAPTGTPTPVPPTPTTGPPTVAPTIVIPTSTVQELLQSPIPTRNPTIASATTGPQEQATTKAESRRPSPSPTVTMTKTPVNGTPIVKSTPATPRA